MALAGRRTAYATVAVLVVLSAAAAVSSLTVLSPSRTAWTSSEASPARATGPNAPPEGVAVPEVPPVVASSVPDLSACTVSAPRTPVPSAAPAPPGSVPQGSDGWQVTSAITDRGTEFSGAIDPAHGVLYELKSMALSDGGPYLLLKVDLSSRVVTVGPTLPKSVTLVVANGYLWAGWATSDVLNQPSPAIVCQFDLTTMALMRTIALPTQSSPGGVAITPGVDGNVIVGDGAALVAITSSDGSEHVINDDLGGQVASTSVSPQGDVAYVTLYGQHPDQTQVVEEVDLRSGTVVARNGGPELNGVGPGSITAVDDGAWLSWRGGMAGSTHFLRKDDLSLLPSPTDPHPASRDGPWDLFFAIMGEGTLYADSVVWIRAGDGQVGCLDPSTGEVRSEFALPNPPGALLGAGNAGGLYLAYQSATGGHLLLTVTPPAACF